MGYYDFIGVKITGQNKNDEKRQILAELNLICAKYDLNFEEIDDVEER